MTESSFTILRVRGIPIGVHWTWLLIFAIVVGSLGTVLFPATYPGLDGAPYLATAVAAALLFFGLVLAHELGHALRTLDEGQHIEGITLWLFVARLRACPNSPAPSCGWPPPGWPSRWRGPRCSAAPRWPATDSTGPPPCRASSTTSAAST